ncbi:hypothetical protein [Ferrimonas marina]|uniref:Uncharacterized protein n=1 Tax=Ferrimonas marina TaxID=299255 RepID=A0A1M5YBW6_9GAMM|nr:hypothetical protein [Ferrimonas marina]SHI09338.1 hypothetical protein SAMN02745129_4043 [Ferrimonas marina]
MAIETVTAIWVVLLMSSVWMWNNRKWADEVEFWKEAALKEQERADNAELAIAELISDIS